MITTCSHCGLLYEELSREATDEPGRVCGSCWREGWRPDGIGGIYQLRTGVLNCDGVHP